MKTQPLSPVRKTRRSRIVSAIILAVTISIFSVNSLAQQAQLSLADFVIGLRSKKVTLEERNKILTEAAKQRGVTFALTPEIEKELESTGADKDLIAAIREKGAVIKAAAVVPAKPETAVVTPPLDGAFYQKRAAASAAKGDLDAAIADYGKAIEMLASDPNNYLNRGVAFYGKKSYDEAMADLNKSIEMKPSSAAYLNRGFVQEKLGFTDKALVDFQKAVDLDANNESAKLNVKRLQDDQAKAMAKAKEAEAASKPAPPPVVSTPVMPESVNLGALSSSNAVRMVTPQYSDVARKSGIEGKVTVNISLDTEGNVTSAKAVTGPAFLRQSAEDAARRTKFKPATFNGTPIKATGSITYNFSRGGSEE